MATKKKAPAAPRHVRENLAAARAHLDAGAVPPNRMGWIEPVHRGWVFAALRTDARTAALDDVRQRAPERPAELLYTVTTLLRAIPGTRGLLGPRVEELTALADPGGVERNVQIVAAAARVALGDTGAYERALAAFDASGPAVLTRLALELATWGYDASSTLAKNVTTLSGYDARDAFAYLAHHAHPGLAALVSNIAAADDLAALVLLLCADRAVAPAVRAQLLAVALEKAPSRFDYAFDAFVDAGDAGLDLAERRLPELPTAARGHALIAMIASPRGAKYVAEASAWLESQALGFRPVEGWAKLASNVLRAGGDAQVPLDRFVALLAKLDGYDAQEAGARIGTTGGIPLPRETLLRALAIQPTSPVLLAAALETEGPENAALRERLGASHEHAWTSSALSMVASGELLRRGVDAPRARRMLDTSFAESQAHGSKDQKGVAQLHLVSALVRLADYEAALDAAKAVPKKLRGEAYATVAVGSVVGKPALAEEAAIAAEKDLTPPEAAAMRVWMARAQLGDTAWYGGLPELRPRPHADESALSRL